jgi:predicted DNA-binding transcriptional regulator YafY
MLLLERRGRMTSRQLADELGVSRRTVMRDIEALGTAGVPVYSARGRAGGYGIWEGFRSQLRGITADEAAALSLLGAEGLAAHLGLGDAVTRVRLKIEQALAPELANEMATIDQRFHHDASPWTGEPPSRAIAFLEVAVRRRRVVRTGTPAGRVIELRPLGLVYKAGDWFVVAATDHERRAFRIADLHGFETTGARFPYPEDFQLKEWWTHRMTLAPEPSPAPDEAMPGPSEPPHA